MSDKLPWYTEWNGIYMPVEDAAMAGAAWTLAVLILGTAGYLVYLFFKLIVEGVKALGRREFDKAALYLVAAAAPMVIGIAIITSSVAASAAEEQERQERSLAYAREIQAVEASPSEALSFERVRGGIAWIDECNSLCDHLVFGEYSLTNTTGQVGFSLSSGTCHTSWISSLGVINPGETLTLFCIEEASGVPAIPCIQADVGYGYSSQTFCRDPLSGRDPRSISIADEVEARAWREAERLYLRLTVPSTTLPVRVLVYIDGHEYYEIPFVGAERDTWGWIQLGSGSSITLYANTAANSVCLELKVETAAFTGNPIEPAQRCLSVD